MRGVLNSQRSPEDFHSRLPLYKFRWRVLAGPDARANGALLDQCRMLFQEHYGVWGPKGPRPGESISLPREQLRTLLSSSESFLACAYREDELAGYAVAVLTQTERGRVAWVSQLIVHESYRKERVATILLFSLWQFSDCFAWGLVTANPLAVRALETATRRSCRRSVISAQGPYVLAKVSQAVDYLPRKLQENTKGQIEPKVWTGFYVSHDKMKTLKEQAARGDRPWNIGDIEPGEEWFACTFRDQTPAALSGERLNSILLGADRVWKDAYGRMTLDAEHKWRQHSRGEAAFVTAALNISPPARILDVGCGDGRHAEEFARMGYEVVGVDVVPELIERAVNQGRSNVEYAVIDAREKLPEGPFGAAVLLYDVLGSSANLEDDLRVLQNVRAVLGDEGRVFISAMNTDVTLPHLPEDQRPGSDEEFVRALEDLPPSNTMQASGNIFDTKHLLEYNGVYYRKEQFVFDETHLPSEHVVRDRRFSVEELKTLLESAGFTVDFIVPAQAGCWDRDPPLERFDTRAKELLAVARIPKESCQGAVVLV